MAFRSHRPVVPILSSFSVLAAFASLALAFTIFGIVPAFALVAFALALAALPTRLNMSRSAHWSPLHLPETHAIPHPTPSTQSSPHESTVVAQVLL